MKRSYALLLGALATALFASCVRVTWGRDWRNTPIPSSAAAELVPGEATLGSCLEALGAPLFVWELEDSCYAIAYGWNEGHGWGVSASVPTGQGVSVSGSFKSQSLDLHGVVLAFDATDRLSWRREGYLRDIAPGLARNRPQVPVEGSAAVRGS